MATVSVVFRCCGVTMNDAVGAHCVYCHCVFGKGVSATAASAGGVNRCHDGIMDGVAASCQSLSGCTSWLRQLKVALIDVAT
jgi:hypothetical protein